MSEQLTALENDLQPKWYGRSVSPIQTVQLWLSKHAPVILPYTQQTYAAVSDIWENDVRLRIVRSLSFPEIDDRYGAISQAQARTLTWLFKHPENVSGSLNNFAGWLASSQESSRPLYWVSGKPGSGKSTLMRLLRDDLRTRAIASQWAGDRKLLISSCFFWNSGTDLQKSQPGLLQTLLHGLLSQYSSFSGDLFPRRWYLENFIPDSAGVWGVDELEHALVQLVTECDQSCAILCLIDGLDEFAGDDSERQTMCTMLRNLPMNGFVKVCVSSRRWNVYLDAFKTYPTLKLEELTKTDINNYVADTFETNEYYHEWSSAQPSEATDLVNTITTRAEGVFLWVRLVVQSLSEGLRNGDDAKDLSRRLSEIPADLEDYFRLIMSKVPPRYLHQASEIFSWALLGSHLVMVFHYTHNDPHRGDHPGTDPEVTLEQVLHLQEIEKRRINARCVGLLETTPTMHAILPKSLHRVDFLHRTARDFIASQPIQDQLQSWRNPQFHAETELFKALVNLLSSCRGKRPWLHVIVQVYYLQNLFALAKAMPGRMASLSEILLNARDDLDAVVQNMCQIWEAEWRSWEVERSSSPGHLTGASGSIATGIGIQRLYMEKPDFLCLALEAGLMSLVLAILNREDASGIVQRTGRSLLDFAINPKTERPLSPELNRAVERLLELGADCNELGDRTTIWAQYLDNIPFFRDVTPAKVPQYSHMLLSAGLTKLLLSHGAQEIVYIDGDQRGLLPPTRAIDILESRYPQDVATEMGELLRNRPCDTVAVCAIRDASAHEKSSSASRAEPPKSKLKAMAKFFRLKSKQKQLEPEPEPVTETTETKNESPCRLTQQNLKTLSGDASSIDDWSLEANSGVLDNEPVETTHRRYETVMAGPPHGSFSSAASVQDWESD